MAIKEENDDVRHDLILLFGVVIPDTIGDFRLESGYQ